MSFYIKLDENGNELSREKRGRGRPKKGYEKNDDGNYYLTTGKSAAKVKTESKEDAEDPVETEKPINIEEPKKAVSLVDFMNGCKPLMGKYNLVSSTQMKMHGVFYNGPTVSKVKKNDVWSYMLVDIQNNVISLWLLRDDKERPSHIVKNAFIAESLEDGTETLKKYATA